MFDFFKKKERRYEKVYCEKNEVIAFADAEMMEIESVADPVFSQKMMGEGVAFRIEGEKIVVCAPANGTLSALFSTGHAFGVTMENGVELLVHIGINTVETKGDGFTLHSRRQGDKVQAGDPIVTVDFKKLAKKYDMTTMLIVTDSHGLDVRFNEPGLFKMGEVIACVK